MFEKEYIPKVRRNPNLLKVDSAWGDIPTILEDICNTFNVGIVKAVEFGVDYGYSTSALSNYFISVTGVDTFEGDEHAGQREQHYESTKNNLASFRNINLIKSDFRDFIRNNDELYDLAHVDIVHDYENTFQCGEWAVQHARVTLFHDTETFPEVKKACLDLAEQYGLEFYNYKDSNGLGILVNRRIERESNNVIYVNVAVMGTVDAVLEKLLDKIKSSGLYRSCKKIYTVINGKQDDLHVDLTNDKFVVLNLCDDVNQREFPTLDLLWENARLPEHENDNILYLHTKGVSHEDTSTINDWVEYLTHFNVEQWHNRLHDLKNFDCTGVNLSGTVNGLNYPPTMWTVGHPPVHYSGNFWWAKNNHIKRLPRPSTWIPPQGDIPPNENYSLLNFTAEMWLCQLEDGKYYNAWSSNVNHYIEHYPKDIYYGKKLKTYDVFPFFNELDMLELRLQTLEDVVDVFVIVESHLTFSGKQKPLYYAENKKRFEKWHHKIRHVVINEIPETNNAWEREYFTRNVMINALYDANPEDIVFLSDCDEIWRPEKKYDSFHESKITCFHMDLFYYNVNTKQLDAIWDIGTKRLRFKDWTSGQEIRTCAADTIIKNGGWHFSYMGDVEQISYKIQSFAHTEYSNEYWTDSKRLSEKISVGDDIFERGRKYTTVEIDESFPRPILENPTRWSTFIKKDETKPAVQDTKKISIDSKSFLTWLNNIQNPNVTNSVIELVKDDTGNYKLVLPQS